MTPADARTANAAAIEVLVRAGAEPSAPHTLTHTLSGAPDALVLVRERFLRDGFSDGGYSHGVLSLVQVCPLEAGPIGAATDKLVGYAKAAGLMYEGWRTLPVRRAGWLARLQRRVADAARTPAAR